MPRRRVVASRSALSLACLTSALLALAACRAAPDTASRSAPATNGQEVLAVVDRLQPGAHADKLTGGSAHVSTAVELTVTFPEDLAGLKLAAHYAPRDPLLKGHALAVGDMLRLDLPPAGDRNDVDLHNVNVRLAQ
jgi:hypothetical protein